MKEPNYEYIKKIVPPIIIIFFFMCCLFLVLTFISYSYFIGPFQFMISVTIAFISIYFGAHSVILAKQANILAEESKKIADESDKKMNAISEHSLVEKISMIYEYINNIEGLKVKGIRVFPSSTPDEKTISNNELKKIISDLDSALKIINYVSDETKNKYFNAFIRLSDVIQTQIEAFNNEDIKDYLRIIKLMKEYQFEDGEKVLDNLKKKWNKK